MARLFEEQTSLDGNCAVRLMIAISKNLLICRLKIILNSLDYYNIIQGVNYFLLIKTLI